MGLGNALRLGDGDDVGMIDRHRAIEAHHDAIGRVALDRLAAAIDGADERIDRAEKADEHRHDRGDADGSEHRSTRGPEQVA